MGLWKDIVAYTLKARIVKSQQPAMTRQRPVNKKRVLFSGQSVPIPALEPMKYVMQSVSKNTIETEKRGFLNGPCTYVISRISIIKIQMSVRLFLVGC
jgi:hypothetical protein